MPSPFPGMDPYLEGHLWPDFHSAITNKVRDLLAPQIRPRCVARLGAYIVNDTSPEAEAGIMYPAAEIKAPVEVSVPSIEIREADSNRLVTVIEFVSPVNKRRPGLADYLDRRFRFYLRDVHLVEIDLLRRGERSVANLERPTSDYSVAMTDGRSGATYVWPFNLDQPLPPLPIRLRSPDEDLVLPLSQALGAVYDEAAYELSIDYTQAPPPPPLSEEQNEWMRRLLKRP